MNSKQPFSFYKAINQFYESELYKLVRGMDRGYLVGTILIAVENIFIFICGIISEKGEDFQSIDKNLVFLNDVENVLLYNNEVIGIIYFGINMYLFIASIVLFALYARDLTTKSSANQQSSSQRNGSQVRSIINIMITLLKQSFSLISCVYHQIVFIPSIYISLNDMTYIIYIINFIFTLYLGFLINDSDYSYQIKGGDCLGKAYSQHQHGIVLIQIIILSAVQLSSISILYLLPIYYLIKLCVFTFYTPYHDRSIQIFNNALLIYFTFISIFFSFAININQANFSLSLLIILFIPFSIRLSFYKEKLMNHHLKCHFQSLFMGTATDSDLFTLDRIIRLNIFSEKAKVKSNEKQFIKLLNARSYELKQIQQNNDSEQESSNDINEGENEGEIINNTSINLKVIVEDVKVQLQQAYQKALLNKKSSSAMHLYLLFLLEFKQNYRIYWITYMKFMHQTKISQKQRQIANSINLEFLKYKKDLKESISYSQSKKINSNRDDSEYSREGQNPFYEGFLRVVMFEEKVMDTYNLIDVACKIKLEILSLMKSKEIQVQQFLLIALKLNDYIKQIRFNLKDIYALNYESSQLYDLKLFYISTLAFSEQEINLQQLYGGISERMNGSNQKIINSALFSHSQCIMFSAFDDKENLIIKHSSSNIHKIFSLSQKDAQNQSIDYMMPSFFSSFHHKYIHKFLSKDRNNEENNSTSEKNTSTSLFSQMNNQQFQGMSGKLLFGQVHLKRVNFIVTPIKIELKLNTFVQKQQHEDKLYYGITACIQSMNMQNEYDYIVYQSTDLQTLGITRTIYSTLAHLNSDLCSTVKKFNLIQLFPFLISTLTTATKDTLIKDFKNTIQAQANQATKFTQNEDIAENYTPTNNNRVKSNFKNMIKTSLQTRRRHTQLIQNFQKQFDHIIIIKNKLSQFVNGEQADFKLNEVQKDENEHSIWIDSFSFFKIEMKIVKPNYQYVKEIHYIEISKMKKLNAYIQSEQIINHIQTNYDSYNKFYSNTFLDSLCDELERKNTRDVSQIHIYDESQQKIELFISEENRDHNNITGNHAILTEFTPKLRAEINAKHTIEFTDNLTVLKQQEFNHFQLNQNQTTNHHHHHNHSLHSTNNLINFNQQPKIHNSHSFQQNCISHSESDQIKFINGSHLLLSKQQLLNIKNSEIQDSMRISSDINILSPKGIQSNFNLIESDLLGSPQLKRKTNQSINTTNFTKDHADLDKNHFLKTKISTQNYEKQMKLKKTTLHTKSDKRKKSASHLKSMKKVIGEEQGEDEELDDEWRQKDELKKKLDNQVEVDSQKSRESSFAHQKRNLYRLLNGNQKVKAVQNINIVGVMSYCLMMAITLYLYNQVSTKVLKSHHDSDYFIWPMQYSSTISQIFKTQNLVNLLVYNVMKAPLTLPTDAAKKQYTSNKLLELNPLLNEFMQYVDQSITIGSNREVFQLMNDNTMEYWIGQYYDPNHLVGVSSVPTEFFQVKKNFSLIYSDVLISMTVFRQVKGLGTGRPEYYSTQNLKTLVAQLSSIQDQILQKQKDEDIVIQGQLTFLLVIVITIAFFCIITVLPLFWFIQSKRQNILSLFATFTLNQIDLMIHQINTAQICHRIQVSAYSKQLSQKNMQTANNIKRQTQGSITPLPKTNRILFIAIIFAYILVIINPILNKIVIENFLTQFQTKLLTSKYLFEVKAYMTESMSINYLCLIMKAKPKLKPFSINLYLDYIHQILDRQQIMDDKLSYLLQNQYSVKQQTINLQQISFQSLFFIKSYNPTNYDDFFFPMLEGDICQILRNYDQYQTDFIQQKLGDCEKIYGSFLQKGLQTAFKQILTVLPQFNYIYTQQTDKQIQDAFNQLNSNLDIKDFNDFQEFLGEAISSLGLFLGDMIQVNQNMIMVFQNGILIYQIIVLSLIFLLGGIQFGFYMNNLLINTKKLLRIIEINQLLLNPYVLTYFKNNMKSD